MGVIYGGRSGEHEVSIASAAAVVQNLDKQRYEPIPIRIEKDGRWIIADRLPSSSSAAEVIEQSRAEAAKRLGRGGREAHLLAHPGDEQIMTIERGTSPTITGLALDVVFPVLHGPYGEDGTVQGLLELANIPYVGAGVLASAVAMDKAVAKALFAARGLPQSRITLSSVAATGSLPQAECITEVTATARLSRYSSNRRISDRASASRRRKATRRFAPRSTLAAEFDRKIVIEAAVPNAREIEIAVLGNDNPEPRCRAKSSHRASSTTTRPNISTTTRVSIIPADLPPEVPPR